MLRVDSTSPTPVEKIIPSSVTATPVNQSTYCDNNIAAISRVANVPISMATRQYKSSETIDTDNVAINPSAQRADQNEMLNTDFSDVLLNYNKAKEAKTSKRIHESPLANKIFRVFNTIEAQFIRNFINEIEHISEKKAKAFEEKSQRCAKTMKTLEEISNIYEEIKSNSREIKKFSDQIVKDLYTFPKGKAGAILPKDNSYYQSIINNEEEKDLTLRENVAIEVEVNTLGDKKQIPNFLNIISMTLALHEKFQDVIDIGLHQQLEKKFPLDRTTHRHLGEQLLYRIRQCIY